MPSISRPLAGPILTFDIAEQIAELRAEESYDRSGRAGRTLAKSGRLRITLVAMQRENLISTHRADSPITLQVLQGGIRFRANGGEHQMTAGQLLFFGPGDANDIRAMEETVLLLTISAVGDDFLIDRTDANATPSI